MGLLTDKKSNLINEQALNREPVPLIIFMLEFHQWGGTSLIVKILVGLLHLFQRFTFLPAATTGTENESVGETTSKASNWFMAVLRLIPLLLFFLEEMISWCAFCACLRVYGRWKASAIFSIWRCFSFYIWLFFLVFLELYQVEEVDIQQLRWIKEWGTANLEGGGLF